MAKVLFYLIMVVVGAYGYKNKAKNVLQMAKSVRTEQ